MAKDATEWFKQAEYDMRTAEAMAEAGRYIYVVFMCHLAVEKALKGLYEQRLGKVPPKVHNLVYLTEKVGLTMPDKLLDAVFTLNRASVPTRYPEDLKSMQRDFRKKKVLEVLAQNKEVLKWLRSQLQK